MNLKASKRSKMHWKKLIHAQVEACLYEIRCTAKQFDSTRKSLPYFSLSAIQEL
jgi:hypothetical protein